MGWYRALVPSKICRALQQGVEPDPDGYRAADAAGSAKVAWLGLTRVLIALADAFTFFANDPATMRIIEDGQTLAEAVDQRFPAHRAFVRPGFDDPGVDHPGRWPPTVDAK